jgi:bifunctional UDP-N-acetylglucosamine pyrophosphorylase/glucosamine-1-phosphate N-acetyltransferase
VDLLSSGICPFLGGKVELKPKCHNKIIQLINKGVDMPNPLTVDMDEAVSVDRVSGNGVKIYPGCRIYGDKTVISEGSKIGYEGPVTVDNCQIGPGVELKGGYFKDAVFLKEASMGLGAHVRGGCILEEQANGAHCVGLKQTILFPFVTLGSLINFCDCLMAGGTSRKDHSEVGSSYIHFNFTPDGDKTTASLIGEVPRGVMLNQPPIFLGGQGGIVGPIRLGYGNVVAAGTILRSDFLKDNRLIVGKPHRGRVIRFVPKSYPRLSRVVGNNLRYLANLLALEQWYIHVRSSFFNGQEFGELVYAGALDKLKLAKRERIKRLKAMAGNMPENKKESERNGQLTPGKCEFRDRIQQVCELFTEELAAREGIEPRDRFLNAFKSCKENNDGNYIDTIQGLPQSVSKEGTRWLDKIVDGLCHKAGEFFPSLALFKV